jgi:TonB family protein
LRKYCCKFNVATAKPDSEDNEAKMIRHWLILMIFSLNVIMLVGQTTSGVITGTETWRGTITLTGDVTVAPSGRLNINPGTVVRMMPSADDQNSGIDKNKIEIVIKGELQAEGIASSGNRIRFTSAASQPLAGDWYGIIIQNKKSTSTIRNSDIEYAFNGITITKSNSKILYNQIQYNYNAGILCKVFAMPTIQGCLIYANGWAGIISEQRSLPVLTENILTNNEIGILLVKKGAANLGAINGDRVRKNIGANRITTNFTIALDNHTSTTIYAQNNYWTGPDNIVPVRIDDIIYDNDENGAFGEVIFEPVFTEQAPIAVAQPEADQALPAERDDIPDTTSGDPPVQQQPTRPQPDPLTSQPITSFAARETQPVTINPATREAQTGDTEVQKDDKSNTPPDDQPSDDQPEKTIEKEKPAFVAPKTPVIEMLTDQKGASYVGTRATPKYPRMALASRTTGDVIVQVIIGENGAVVNAKVVKSDSELLNNAALSAARQNRYNPMTMQGQPVKVRKVERYRFKR